MSIVHIRTNSDGEEVQFRPDAAASFRRVEHQAGREVSVSRTVVPYEVQADLYAQFLRGEYPYTVAHPDESDHVYRTDDDGGNAWDTEERGEWLDENGWIADVKDEPWHRRYVAALDQHINDPDPATLNQSEEDDMKAIRLAGVINSGIIIQPGVPPYSLEEQVFLTQASTYGLPIVDLPDWRYGTAVREHWTAFNTAQAFAKDDELSQADVDKVAAAFREAIEAREE